VKKLLLIIALSAAVGQSAYPIELRSTPVQDAMFWSMNSDEWDDQTAKPASGGVADSEDSQGSRVARKSIAKAFLLSALVPGAGQYYVGNRKKARVFFAAETMTWISYISFRTYGNWKKDDYIRYGNTYAGASLDDKDDEFLDMVAFYEDIDQYNTLGRAFDPERPYYPDTPEYHWRWPSEYHQQAFRELKNRSREAYRKSDFVLGIAIVTRIVSVVDAVRDATRINRKTQEEFSRTNDLDFRFDVDPLDPRRQVTLTLYTPF
jgi:hypothetical protein